MKIAVTYDGNGSVFQHFGRTEIFRIYTIEDGKITAHEDADSSKTGGHSALAPFLKERGVEALIAGGIGGGARAALASYGIEVYPGVSGSADEAAKAFAEGRLSFDPSATCHHHDHEEGHSCAHHGGNGGCGHHEGHSCC